ncbi:MAG: tetratricopeptide repeat protein [Holophagales bacterium]|nr:tetratricopeptide repeat protein [Holophagales bacterium]MBK9963972.1 tetratricopeptide repeat protein [Holophagales bacterium]
MSRRAAPLTAPAPIPPAAGRWEWLRTLLLPAAVLVALVLLAHGPSIRATFIWDDDVYVTANRHLHDAAGLFDMWFRLGATKQYDPLVFTTFWLEHRLWGLDPLGYHAVNIVFHALDVLLLWVLLGRLRVRGAWLAAAVFATHPVFVQSVAWVSELKNVQSAFFALLCLLAHFRFSLPEGTAGARAGGGREWRFYALSLVLFAAALTSKPTVVSLPLLILLVIFWKRGTVDRTDVLATVPMFLMSVALGVIAIHVERHFGGATGAAWHLPPLERLVVAAKSLWFYVGKLVWPVPLMSNYPRWDTASRELSRFVPLLAAIGAAVGLWLGRGRIGRGPFVAAAGFTVLVAPLTGLFDVAHHLYSFVADHFQYHAAPALIALAAAGAASLRDRLRNPLRNRGAVAGFDVATGVLLLGLVLMSRRHTQVFLSEKTRCLDTLSKNPNAWVAMNNLGVALNAEGNPAEAVRWYREALRVRPVYPEAQSNLGVALVALGDAKGAIRHLEEALSIWPGYANGRNNLGTAQEAAGDVPAALRQYREAVRLDPDHARAHNNLARLLARTGDVEAALSHHRDAIRLRPGWAEAHRDLGTTLASAGRTLEAIEAYAEALKLQPGDATALNGLGLALASSGRLEEARARFGEALRAEPRHAEAHNNLGTSLATGGDLDGATRHFEEAVRLKPDYADARRNLGTAALSRGDVEAAERQLKEAARLAPDDARAYDLLGVALARAGRLGEAIGAFERAVALDPASASFRQNLAEAQRVQGRGRGVHAARPPR